MTILKYTSSAALINALLLCLLPTESEAFELDVSTNLVAPLAGAFAIGIDVALTQQLSIEALVGIGVGSEDVGGTKAWDYNWYPSNLIGKYYFSPSTNADGFFVQAFARYEARSYDWVGGDLGYDPDYSATRFGLGAGGGYKYVFDFGLVLEAQLGVGYELVRTDSENTPDRSAQIPKADWDKLLQLGKLGLGYRF